MPIPAQSERGGLKQSLMSLLNEPAGQRGMMTVVVINLFILMCRPQNNIAPLAITRLPMLLSLVPLLVVLPRVAMIWRESRATKAMCLILLFGFAWVPLARNNYWALHTARDLLQQYFCYLFPIIILGAYGARLRRVVNWLLLCGIYLGAYSVTHVGRGPSGFLGDENDMALTLLAFLGIALGVLPVSSRGFTRITAALCAVSTVAGIVVTMSRGGFVGLLCLLAYTFIHSRHKVFMLFAAMFLATGAVTLAPSEYWKEMGTITDTKESTAAGRIEIWKVGLKMWLSPEHFLFGSGMQNTSVHLHEYEPEINKSRYGRSIAGRAVHSTYVQLICDLGLLGVMLFLTAVGGALTGNNRVRKLLKRLPEKIQSPDDQASSVSLAEEKKFISALFTGINSGLIGALGAATFVSALYYPTIWLMVSLSVVLQHYSLRLRSAVSELHPNPKTVR